jgi:hypothetical protein
MFLVKQEPEHQHASTSSSSSSSTTSNPIESNAFNIDAVSSSSPYEHIDYTNNPNPFWSLPPYVTS